jgi:hypothetical protein
MSVEYLLRGSHQRRCRLKEGIADELGKIRFIRKKNGRV